MSELCPDRLKRDHRNCRRCDVEVIQKLGVSAASGTISQGRIDAALEAMK